MKDMWQDAYGYLHFGDQPELNTKKVLEVWDWLTLHQGTDTWPTWDQGDYMKSSNRGNRMLAEEHAEQNYCGTAACVAGFVALPVTKIEMNGFMSVHRPPMKGEFQIDGTTYELAPQPSRQGAFHEIGRLVLGLSYHEANALFEGGNDLDDIRACFNRILEHRGEPIRL